MSHQTSQVILDSLLPIFDPNNTEYAGVRDHYSAQELEKIDELRAKPEGYELSFLEKVFVSYVIDKLIFT